MKKRLMIHMKNGQPIPLEKLEGVTNRKDVLQVWSIEKPSFSTSQSAEETNKKDWMNANLRRGNGVCPEDFVHDWLIRDNQFHIYSKAVKRGESITLLVEVA